ncbi:uncharacterized protein LOC101845506 [Aplysia californica]|uniref:Uncharacterized protein LOC101845506 n=1 Tax=Aplysia californica TaxID=6500 RepID=A0ABM1ABL3_APLCA|nr:uncharacterized protein LOC101845506 [Aplysia californica]
MFSLVTPQSTNIINNSSANIVPSQDPWSQVRVINRPAGLQTQPASNTLSFAPAQLQIQYLQQQTATGALGQPVQVMGSNNQLLMTPVVAGQNPVPTLLQNATGVFPMARPAQQTQQPQPGMGQFIIQGSSMTTFRGLPPQM